MVKDSGTKLFHQVYYKASGIMKIKQLSAFYQAASADRRIGACHISLYMALFHLWQVNGFRNPVLISRAEVMPAAKINGRATYHKCMKELQEYGYIEYAPSFNPAIKSRVRLLENVRDRK